MIGKPFEYSNNEIYEYFHHGIGDVSKILVAIPLPHDLNKFFERLKLGIQGFFFFLHSLEFEGEVGKMEYDFSKFVDFNLEIWKCI